ncbi:MAG TPA: enoyl-CoA hydratase/isomerase family protein [Pyrinomonadaceae bacterium]|jgi:enoyl-CoA hydratase|nr:enoyl-CoA hydratase/isomerase family protein [Pyrinomonadaceae bacterium]
MSDANQSPEVVVEHDDDVVIIRFNRPATRNSLSRTTLDALESIFLPLSEQANLKIIFTGSGDVFASGADLREIAALDAGKAKAFSQRGQALFQMIATARPLTIAAINGYCMGGALDFALACDLRVAASSAVFAHPGANLGIITGWGGTQRLPKLIGRSQANELFFTARRFTAAEALQFGLVTGINDPVLDAAIKLARQTKKR